MILKINNKSKPNTIAPYIKSQRLKKKLTQKQFAELTGLKQSNIARLESGTVEPRITTLTKLSKVIKFSKSMLNETVNRTSKMLPSSPDQELTTSLDSEDFEELLAFSKDPNFVKLVKLAVAEMTKDMEEIMSKRPANSLLPTTAEYKQYLRDKNKQNNIKVNSLLSQILARERSK